MNNKISLARTIADIKGILLTRPHPASKGVTISRIEAALFIKLYDKKTKRVKPK